MWGTEVRGDERTAITDPTKTAISAADVCARRKKFRFTETVFVIE
jgi:hypothetical protein